MNEALYIQSVRDNIVSGSGTFSKVDNFAEVAMELGYSYPFAHSEVTLDSVSGENNKDIWLQLNKYAKVLAKKLPNGIEAETPKFVMHHNFKINGTAGKAGVSYMPFTVTLSDGQMLTALVRNSEVSKSYQAKKPTVVMKWAINAQDITREVYKNGDDAIDMATTVARLAKIIGLVHTRFVLKHPVAPKADLAKEIDGMELDLGETVWEHKDNKKAGTEDPLVSYSVKTDDGFYVNSEGNYREEFEEFETLDEAEHVFSIALEDKTKKVNHEKIFLIKHTTPFDDELEDYDYLETTDEVIKEEGGFSNSYQETILIKEMLDKKGISYTTDSSVSSEYIKIELLTEYSETEEDEEEFTIRISDHPSNPSNNSSNMIFISSGEGDDAVKEVEEAIEKSEAYRAAIKEPQENTIKELSKDDKTIKSIVIDYAESTEKVLKEGATFKNLSDLHKAIAEEWNDDYEDNKNTREEGLYDKLKFKINFENGENVDVKMYVGGEKDFNPFTDTLNNYLSKNFKAEMSKGETVNTPVKEDNPTDAELIAQIESNEVYKQVLKDSHGGVMYNVDDAAKYDAKEILELWDRVERKDAADGIMKGAINFLLEAPKEVEPQEPKQPNPSRKGDTGELLNKEDIASVVKLLKDRLLHPLGEFDDKKRFYLKEHELIDVREPSKRYPYSHMKAGRTKKFVDALVEKYKITTKEDLISHFKKDKEYIEPKPISKYTPKTEEFLKLTIDDLDRATEIMEELTEEMEKDSENKELKDAYEAMNKHLDGMVG